MHPGSSANLQAVHYQGACQPVLLHTARLTCDFRKRSTQGDITAARAGQTLARITALLFDRMLVNERHGHRAVASWFLETAFNKVVCLRTRGEVAAQPIRSRGRITASSTWLAPQELAVQVLDTVVDAGEVLPLSVCALAK